MKKLTNIIVFLFICVALRVSQVNASPVSVYRAKKVASNFWNRHNDNGVGSSGKDTLKLYEINGFDAFYVFTKSSTGGFVIVAADDRVIPILAYSFENEFMIDGNANARYWLSIYQQQIEELSGRDTDETATTRRPGEVTAQESWAIYETEPACTEHEQLTAVSPLLSTTWDQYPYYNALCPYDNYYNAKTVAGCVATAMAQVMKYWNYPTRGTGYHGYVTNNYGILSANFGATTYDWQNMPVSLTASSNQQQVNAVATLMYHCGVAIEMNYGVAAVGGSGAYLCDYGNANMPCTQHALVDFFGYKDSIIARYRTNNDILWKSYVKNEIDAARPVLYAGYDNEGGHCFVCDGYNQAETHFHFNWGWGGYCDGYYLLSNLAPGAGGAGGNATYTFNQDQQILTGVCPPIDSVPGSNDNYRNFNEIVVGDSSNTTYNVNVPINNRYNYSLCQIIVSHDELEDSVPLRSISFFFEHTQPMQRKDSVSIWIQPTVKSTFSSFDDLVLLDRLSAKCVYRGSLNCNPGWNLFSFDSVFFYADSLNLLIVVDDNSGSCDGSLYRFANSPADGFKTIAWFSNSDNPSVEDTVFDGFKFRYDFRPLLKFNAVLIPTYTVVAESSSAYMGSVTGSGVYHVGDTAVLTAMPCAGFHFSYWNDGSTQNPRVLTVLGDASYVAYFTMDNVATYYSITAEPCDSTMGYVTGGGTFQSGSVTVLEAFPFQGFRFVSWNDGVSVNRRNIVVTGSEMYTALFEQDDVYYTIVVESVNQEMGVVSGGGTFLEGDTARLVATPSEGFIFSHWNDASVDNPRDMVVSSNCMYLAYFAPAPVTHANVLVSSNDSTMGIVVGSGTYSIGTTVSIRAMAFENYDFLCWTDGVVDNPRRATVLCDTTFNAIFIPKSSVEDVIEPQLSVFPNPTKGLINVSTLSSIVVLDLRGRELQRCTECNSIDISLLPKGLYLLKITTGDKTYIKHIMLSK